LQPHFPLAALLASSQSTRDVQKVADLIEKFYDTQGKVLELINFFVKEEVAQTKQYTTLFRSNSLATKVMSAWSRQGEGFEYLSNVMSQPVSQTLNGSLGSLEVCYFSFLFPSPPS
jgi:hypothetical protein